MLQICLACIRAYGYSDISTVFVHLALAWWGWFHVCSCKSLILFLIYHFVISNWLHRKRPSVPHLWQTSLMHCLKIFHFWWGISLSWLLYFVFRHKIYSYLVLYLRRWSSSRGVHTIGHFSYPWILSTHGSASWQVWPSVGKWILECMTLFFHRDSVAWVFYLFGFSTILGKLGSPLVSRYVIVNVSWVFGGIHSQ